MIEPSKFALFMGVAWVLIIAPGPDMLFVLTQGMAHGPRAGIVSALGVVCGILVHTTAAAFGLTLLLRASTPAFLIVKYLGAAYLIHLGIKAWQDKSTFHLQTSNVDSRSLFWQGVISNVLNPKIAIFFLAFLPQFVDQAGRQVVLQMAILGLIFAFFGMCFLVVVGYFVGSVGTWLTHQPRSTNLLRWLTGGVLVGLGTRLALPE